MLAGHFIPRQTRRCRAGGGREDGFSGNINQGRRPARQSRGGVRGRERGGDAEANGGDLSGFY